MSDASRVTETLQFTGKIAVVTGAANGIGEAYAMRLAQEGAKVAVVDIDRQEGERVARVINAAGGRASFHFADVSSSEDCAALAHALESEFGGVDFLVDNAAIFGKIEYIPLLEVDFDYYLKVQAVNMNGCLVMSRAIVPLLKKRGGGVIINQTSTAAWVRDGGFYGIFKLAMNGITTNLAMELGDHNIRVNAIAPGPTDTSGLRAKVSPALLNGL
jgi:NAD(P)-dependent dehydrogenase (short-subunit alcohol dehydrogenase family)